MGMKNEFTVKEFAEKERVSTRTVQSWLAKGLVGRTKSVQILAPDENVTIADRHGYAWSWFSGVYFVLCDRFIKIGWSQDVRLRLEALRTSNPHPIEPLGFVECGDINAARTLESTLHARFHHLHERYEWFMDDPELREHICTASSLWPRPKQRVQ